MMLWPFHIKSRPSPNAPYVYLGAYGTDYLKDRSMQPVMGIGPTGCGKTSGMAYPTLAAGWSHAAVVWDYKGVMAEDTAELRTAFGPVLLLDLGRRGGTRYNPLMSIRGGDLLVQDAQHVARILCETDRPTFWDRAAFSYIVGVIVHVLTSEPDKAKTLAGVRDFIVRGDAAAKRMMEPGMHPTARRAAQELWSREPMQHAPAERSGGEGSDAKGQNMRQGVYTTASVLLADFEAPILAEQTAVSDFQISDLVCGDRPVTLYLIARPMDARQLRQVYRLVLTQIIDRLTVERGCGDDGRRKNWKLLFLLDEFLQFHMIEMAEWIKYVREYGIRPYLLAQSLWEVEKQYGQGLVNNCRLVTFRPESQYEAERISRMVGTVQEDVPTTTVTRRRWWEPASVTRGARLDRREVLPAHEVQQLGPDEILVFGYGKPIRAQRIRYYEVEPWISIHAYVRERQTARQPLRVPPWMAPPGANRWLNCSHSPTKPSSSGAEGAVAPAKPKKSLKQLGI